MDIAIEPIAGSEVTRIRIEGRIDSYTVQRVEEEIQSLIRIGTSKLVCDLSQVEFVAGPGLKVFLKAMQEARKQEGDLKLCGARPEVEKLFSLAGFTSVATLYPTEAAALAGFGNALKMNQYGQIMVDAGDDSAHMQTLVRGGDDDDVAGYMATMVPEDNTGFDKTLVPETEDEGIGYLQTMPAGQEAIDTGFMQTLLNDPGQGFDQTLVEGIASANQKSAETVTGAEAEETADLSAATLQIDNQTCETIFEQIDSLDCDPSSATVNLTAETLSVSTAPVIEPLAISLSCDESHLSNIFRLINTLAAVTELDSKRATHYAEAVTEVLRAAMQDKMMQHPIKLVLQPGEQAMGAIITVPSTKFKLGEQLRPSTDRKVNSRETASAWLKKSTGAVEERVEASRVVIVLKA